MDENKVEVDSAMESEDSLTKSDDINTDDVTPAVIGKTSNNFMIIFLLFVAILGILLSYYNISNRLAKLEQSLTVVESSLPGLPQATIDAILALQNGEQGAQQPNAAPPPSGGVVSIDDDAFVGDRTTASLAIIEFSDLNCPFCARFHTDTLDLLLDKYVRSGQAIYVYRDYIGVGGNVTLAAASAAECVKSLSNDQTYLEVVQGLYAAAGTKNVNMVRDLAASYEIDDEALDTSIQEDRFREEVLNDTRAGQAVGARGTPAFIIGQLRPDGSVEGSVLPGAQPFEVFERIIDEQLANGS